MGKRIWTCCICGKSETWRKGWCWYGSLRDIDDSVDIPAMCSDECAEAHRVKNHLPPASMGPMSPKAVERWQAEQFKQS